ncbi:MAG TPA: N-acetyltransferase [Caldithrix abyssi]|uniref:N-acetyltransferase n=1 Tax=Caldithrix abyssi TaxID=187145 RepID=A0A7V4WTU9_CALAY|nr:N-acetyltransferase [Caldithrix abyssi]
MSVQIKTVRSSREKNLFIDLEWRMNKNTPNWVSPLRMERKKILDTKKNPFYKHAEIELFIAYKDGVPAGRIAAITNENHNAFHNDKAGFWGFFECIDDQETANALFEAAADWLRAKDRDHMLGPMNPSTNDECGLLIDGYDTPPFIMMTHNPTYYPTLVEGFGNTKAKDLFAWYSPTKDAVEQITEKMRRVAGKILKKYNITVRNINIKKLDEEIKLIKEVYNDAWSNNYAFVPFTEEEIDAVAADLKPLADENLIYIAEREGRPVAFSVTIPNINEILAKIPNGRLFPTGIFKLLTGMKKIKTVRVIILGVIKELQFSGLGSVFYVRTIENAYKAGYIGGEMSWILEDNHTMNRAIASFGSKKYKTYRLYSYPL